jgi:hypothetical protein
VLSDVLVPPTPIASGSALVAECVWRQRRQQSGGGAGPELPWFDGCLPLCVGIESSHAGTAMTHSTPSWQRLQQLSVTPFLVLGALVVLAGAAWACAHHEPPLVGQGLGHCERSSCQGWSHRPAAPIPTHKASHNSTARLACAASPGRRPFYGHPIPRAVADLVRCSVAELEAPT